MGQHDKHHLSIIIKISKSKNTVELRMSSFLKSVKVKPFRTPPYDISIGKVTYDFAFRVSFYLKREQLINT